jgi:hypothetical protein
MYVTVAVLHNSNQVDSVMLQAAFQGGRCWGPYCAKVRQPNEFHIPVASRAGSVIRRTPSRNSVRPGVHLIGARVYRQPTEFHVSTTSRSKAHN